MNVVNVIVRDSVTVTIDEGGVGSDDNVTIVVDDVVEGSGDKSYVHSQVAPASDVTINHNLDKFPSVTVIDSAGDVVVGDVQYVDSDNVRLQFSGAMSFTAYLN